MIVTVRVRTKGWLWFIQKICIAKMSSAACVLLCPQPRRPAGARGFHTSQEDGKEKKRELGKSQFCVEKRRERDSVNEEQRRIDRT